MSVKSYTCKTFFLIYHESVLMMKVSYLAKIVIILELLEREVTSVTSLHRD